MAITKYDWFYDAQQRRFLEQLVRAFSGFQYRTGRREGQEPQLIQVPCRLAATNRMVAHIMRNESENVLLSVPMITVWQSNLKFTMDRLQYPGHVDTRQAWERAIDPQTGDYAAEGGVRYTVERLMPRPFEMQIQVDVWTSNLDQKHQLSEQILTVIAPTFDIQNGENPLDWSALSMCFLEDITWSSRNIPVGTQDEIDVMTINLRLPMWLSPPAKVMQQRRIEQIVTNIYAGTYDADSEQMNGDLLSTTIVTPGNHLVSVENGRIRLLNNKGGALGENGLPLRWDALLEIYGKLRPGISRLTLKTETDLDSTVGDIVGTIQIDNSDPSMLIWQIDPDTLPANTIAPVTAVIEPLRTYPGAGLPTAVAGQRYLVLDDIGASVAWPGLQARAGDIIAYNGSAWTVAFHPGTTRQVVLNQTTGRQLRWNGQEWVMAIDGVYAPGYWRLAL